MEQLDHRPNHKPEQPPRLPGEPKYYRYYFCKACCSQSYVCSSCDRAQIYCPDCKIIQNQERIRRARNKYKKSRKGRLKRAFSSQSRRNKIKAKIGDLETAESAQLKKIEGDRGPLVAQVLSKTPLPAIPAEQKPKGASEHAQFSNPLFNFSSNKGEQLPGRATQIICSFCKRECPPFQRQKKGRLGPQEKKNIQRWWARTRDEDP
jgi:hypothetical protein